MVIFPSQQKALDEDEVDYLDSIQNAEDQKFKKRKLQDREDADAFRLARVINPLSYLLFHVCSFFIKFNSVVNILQTLSMHFVSFLRQLLRPTLA